MRRPESLNQQTRQPWWKHPLAIGAAGFAALFAAIAATRAVTANIEQAADCVYSGEPACKQEYIPLD